MATSTLAWGVNTPTHTVVIKSTVFYDWKAGRYAQLPLTDLIQVCTVFFIGGGVLPL